MRLKVIKHLCLFSTLFVLSQVLNVPLWAPFGKETQARAGKFGETVQQKKERELAEKRAAELKDAQKKAVKAIGPAMKRAEKAGASFKYKTGGGHTGNEIVKYAQKGKYDMIIIGARGMGGAKEAFLGSTSNYVMHKTKIPVLVVK